MGLFFIPVFNFRGHRYRARLRWLGGWHWRVLTERFPEGCVARRWLGPFLLTVMID
jgi:hypothetical protein